MHYDWVKPAMGEENSQNARAGLNSLVPSCCRPPLFLGNDPTQDFTLTPNVIWGGGDWVCLSWPMGGLSISLSLSTLFWSFVVVISFVSQLFFSSIFCFDALEYAYGPTLQMHPMFVISFVSQLH